MSVLHFFLAFAVSLPVASQLDGNGPSDDWDVGVNLHAMKGWPDQQEELFVVAGEASLMLGSRCLMLDAWCLMLDAWCLMLDAWCLMLDAWCLMLDAWCLMLDAWCLMLDAWNNMVCVLCGTLKNVWSAAVVARVANLLTFTVDTCKYLLHCRFYVANTYELHSPWMQKIFLWALCFCKVA